MSLVIGDHSSGSLDLFDEEEVTEGGEEEEEEEEGGDWKSSKNLHLGPQVPLKHQLEKDKGDESLRRWKEQLLGNVDMNSVGVDSKKAMLGTFSPQLQPYVCEMPEEITPSGIFVRGSYSARSRLVDDDNKRYLETNYTFDIRKEWAHLSH